MCEQYDTQWLEKHCTFLQARTSHKGHEFEDTKTLYKDTPQTTGLVSAHDEFNNNAYG